MRICPRCGYIDPFCWRDAYSRGMEVEYTRIDELEQYQPEIAKRLKEAVPNKKGVREWQDKNYAYGLWPSGYVRRRWLEIYKHQGWKAIPMEQHNPKDDHQTKIAQFSTEKV